MSVLMILLLLETGCKFSEIIVLDTEDIYLDNYLPFIIIRSNKIRKIQNLNKHNPNIHPFPLDVTDSNKTIQVFENIKDTFDQKGLLNPHKIVRPYKLDDRQLLRYKPDYKTKNIDTQYDWSNWGSFSDAIEMCNNNGACRKINDGVMCPSYRVTKEEKDLVRGRANTLRLALSNQLPEGSFASKEMYETMELCVSCKACQRECPMSVDMAKMKSKIFCVEPTTPIFRSRASIARVNISPGTSKCAA